MSPLVLRTTDRPPYATQDTSIQEVVLYCASRFRAYLTSPTESAAPENEWLKDAFNTELAFCLSYIGMAATLGITIDIPIIIRVLAQFQYPYWDTTTDCMEGSFNSLLDAGCEDGDLTAVAPSYLNDWWLWDEPASADVYLNDTNIMACLQHHRNATGIKGIQPPTLSKPSYTWSRHLYSAYFNVENPGCTKCRLYRGVTLAMLDDLQDLRRSVEGLEVAYEADSDLTQRRAAGFFKLYEAAAHKESNNGSLLDSPAASKSSKGKGKAKATGNAPAMNESRRIASADEWARYKNLPQLKWTCGEPLNVREVLKALEHPQHCGRQHSGYICSLPEDPHDNGSNSSTHASPAGTPKFDHIADDNIDVPELGTFQCPHHFSYPPLRHEYGGPPSDIPTHPPSLPSFIPPTTISIPNPPLQHHNPRPASSTRGQPLDLTGSIDDVAAETVFSDSNPPASSTRGITVIDLASTLDEDDDVAADKVFPDSDALDDDHVTSIKHRPASSTRSQHPLVLTGSSDEDVAASDVFTDSDATDLEDVAAMDIFSDPHDEPTASTSGQSDDDVAAGDIYSDAHTDEHGDVDADDVFSSEDADNVDADDDNEANPHDIFSDNEGGPSDPLPIEPAAISALTSNLFTPDFFGPIPEDYLEPSDDSDDST